jgi:uncharacterized protein (DUF58 family)
MPTRLGWSLILLLGGIAFAAINTGNNLLYLLLGLCAAAIGLCFVAGGRALRRVRLSLSYPEEILAGEPTAMVVVVDNPHRRLASPTLEMQLRGGKEPVPDLSLPPLPPGTSRTRFVPTTFRRRGLFRAGRVQVATSDPLGLVLRRRTLRPRGHYYVYPSPLALERREEALAHERGEVPDRRVGEGLELHQMRDYLWSDDSRHIDWRATARAGHLMVKEFLEANAEHLLLIFDPAVDRLTPEIRSRFEEQVSLATAVVLRCTEGRTAFRFLAPDREFSEVDPPGGHRPVLEYLATVEPRPAAGEATFAADLDGLPGVIRLGVPREAPA